MYIRKTPNPGGAYPSPQSTPAPGLAYISDEQTQSLIEYNGFVTLEFDGDAVISVAPNIEAWEAWKASLPPPGPEPEPEPTEIEVLRAQVNTLSVATSIAFVTLAERGDIDDVTAGEHADMFAPWASPVAYKVGDIRRYDGDLYRCIQEHTSQTDWTPDAAVSLWVKIAAPADEWPEWSQPIGAHDAYQTGDKVTHGGQHWVSAVDNNVWTPGVYGWEQAAEGEIV